MNEEQIEILAQILWEEYDPVWAGLHGWHSLGEGRKESWREKARKMTETWAKFLNRVEER